MEIFGHVENGVVVLEGGVSLPEGTRVSVSTDVEAPSNPEIVSNPGELPFVRGGAPGSVRLTNERVAEILEQEELDALKRQWNVPS